MSATKNEFGFAEKYDLPIPYLHRITSYNNNINKLPTKTMPEDLKKWLESIPEGYELSGFKRGEYYGEKQVKLFLRRK